MTDINQIPMYNLKAVAHETGLSPDVLHAWERRYGLPQPQRSPGGHRLYSQYDIAMLKWLQARQEEGLSISQAAGRWKELAGQGLDPLVGFAQVGAMQPGNTTIAGADQIDFLRNQWKQACLRFDESSAGQVLDQAFSIYPVEMVCREFFQHGLSQFGEEWYRGRISVQQEHFTSNLASRRIEALISSAPAPTRSQSIMVACPPGEWHTIPALLMGLFLRRRGFRLVYLGADVPKDRMLEAVSAVKPALVVLAAQRLTTAATLAQMASVLQGIEVLVGFGGYIFNRNPSLRRRIPALFLGETIEASVHQVEVLAGVHQSIDIDVPQGLPNAMVIPEFIRKRPWIDAEVIAQSHPDGPSIEQISMANAFFGDDLAAALELDNHDALVSEIEWLNKRLLQLNIPLGWLKKYLSIYKQAVQHVLGADAGVIPDWITSLV